MKTVIFISLRTIEEVETKYEICPRATKRERWKTEGDDKAVLQNIAANANHTYSTMCQVCSSKV